mgnify:CR=1 FL=1
MMNILGLVVGVTLIFMLKGKALLRLGLILLLWTTLVFVLDFFDAEKLDNELNGALVYFSMYGVFIAFPIGIICLIVGTIKYLKEKYFRSGK